MRRKKLPDGTIVKKKRTRVGVFNRVNRQHLQSVLDNLKKKPASQQSEQDRDVIVEIETYLGHRPQSRSNPFKVDKG